MTSKYKRKNKNDVKHKEIDPMAYGISMLEFPVSASSEKLSTAAVDVSRAELLDTGFGVVVFVSSVWLTRLCDKYGPAIIGPKIHPTG